MTGVFGLLAGIAAALVAAFATSSEARPRAGQNGPPQVGEAAPASAGDDPGAGGDRVRPPVPPRLPPRRGALAGHDVLLLVLDAARADAISAYGAPRPTPVIDALAAEGTRVERALSTAAWTAPAIGSLLTGLHPRAHGVDDWNVPAPASAGRLAQAFADAGYDTRLWSSHTLYRANRSLREGFERTQLLRVAERDRLPAAADLGDDNRPRFNLVHLLVPHTPYEAPAPFAGRYADAAASALDLSPAALRRLGRDPTVTADDPRVRAARDRYDEMMAWADAQVGRLLEALEASGRAPRTLVVLTSDHGEAFLEHGLLLHTRDVHDEMTRVPLIFRWPPVAELDPVPVLAGPASLADVPATLVDLFALPWEARVHGRSLAPHLLAEPSAADSSRSELVAFASARGMRAGDMTRRPWWLMLERDGWQIIVDAFSDAAFLYNAEAGHPPRDQAAERPDLVAELRALARAQHRADRGFRRRLVAAEDRTPG